MSFMYGRDIDRSTPRRDTGAVAARSAVFREKTRTKVQVGPALGPLIKTVVVIRSVPFRSVLFRSVL